MVVMRKPRYAATSGMSVPNSEESFHDNRGRLNYASEQIDENHGKLVPRMV